MTMKNELQHMAKKLSSTTLDKESVQSSLARSEERNHELCEQVNEAQQEVRRFVVTYSVQNKLTCMHSSRSKNDAVILHSLKHNTMYFNCNSNSQAVLVVIVTYI